MAATGLPRPRFWPAGLSPEIYQKKVAVDILGGVEIENDSRAKVKRLSGMKRSDCKHYIQYVTHDAARTDVLLRVCL